MRRLILALLTCSLCLTAVACTGGDQDDESAAVTAVAQDFLTAWAKRDYGAAARATDQPDAALKDLKTATGDLGAKSATLQAQVATVDGDQATVPFTASWSFDGLLKPWTYDGKITLAQQDKDWTITWSAATIHPDLHAGDRVMAERSLPERASLLDRTGKPLFTKTDVVDVGVEPRRVTDIDSLVALLGSELDVDPAEVKADIEAAEPTHFVPVITLRRPDYEAVKPAIYDVPGTVFREDTRLLPPTPQFAKLLLGSVGTATADVLETLGDGYLATDEVGLSGLQAAYNKQLTGTAGATIVAESTTKSNVKPGSTETTPLRRTIGTIAGSPGTSVKLTLDVATQEAADAALADVTQQASIVAIKPSTGEVLAVSNSPNTSYDIAMEGRYPAGSTFKIITATSVLANGVAKPDDVEACPGELTVDGKVFHNEDSFDLGSVPLTSAFAHSCNTTFIQLAGQLDPDALPTTAAQFGMGAEWDLPVSTFSGSVPAAASTVEQAADAIGQGRVEVSPFAMALAAAAVVHGTTPTPSLIAGEQATPANPPAAPPADVIETLRTFMRATVTEGTATELADAPGGEVSGKTGTAEYGTKVPPDSHAWFAGYQGDLAFAVFVEGGQSSSTTAVPIADSFLTALHS